jgi:hypothetical protein
MIPLSQIQVCNVLFGRNTLIEGNHLSLLQEKMRSYKRNK